MYSSSLAREEVVSVDTVRILRKEYIGRTCKETSCMYVYNNMYIYICIIKMCICTYCIGCACITGCYYICVYVFHVYTYNDILHIYI